MRGEEGRVWGGFDGNVRSRDVYLGFGKWSHVQSTKVGGTAAAGGGRAERRRDNDFSLFKVKAPCEGEGPEEL